MVERTRGQGQGNRPNGTPVSVVSSLRQQACRSTHSAAAPISRSGGWNTGRCASFDTPPAAAAQDEGRWGKLVGRKARTTLLAFGTLLAASVAAGAAPPSRSAAFDAFLASVRQAADQAGVSSATFDAATRDLTPDPTVAALTRKQPEFAKPIGAYLAAQVTASRIATGRAALAHWHDDLARIEQRFGVPPAIVVAVWGLETNFGSSIGDKDVIRSLATLGAAGWRPDLMRDELVAALELLQSGAASRADLRGSGAGAMGQPQFMPSSFAKYAVDEDGDGRRDIWTDVPDALASIANFLKQQGWQPGLPWGFEVRLPAGFDVGQSHGSFAEWTARGLTRPDGAALPADGGATLFFPAGAAGPAFLVTANYPVIKTYNFSDAYVLSVATLADRMEGGPAVAGSWPTSPGMSREDRIALQTRLAARGLPVDNREGRISLELRDTIRVAQKQVGLTPDGNPTDALLQALSR